MPEAGSGMPAMLYTETKSALVVLAVTVAVLGEVPTVLNAPVILIRLGLDRTVHLPVDLDEGLPRLWGQGDSGGLGRIDSTFLPPLLAEAGAGGGRVWGGQPPRGAVGGGGGGGGVLPEKGERGRAEAGG